MTKCIFITSIEPKSGKAGVALGLVAELAKNNQSVGVYRPLATAASEDELNLLLSQHEAVSATPSGVASVTYSDIATRTDQAISEIISSYHTYKEVDTVVALGSDYSGPLATIELQLNGRIAVNLDASVVLCLCAKGRSLDLLGERIHGVLNSLSQLKATVTGIVVTGVDEAEQTKARQALAEFAGYYQVAIMLDGEQALADNVAGILKASLAERPHAQTPLAFQQMLMDKARSDLKTIVLPESEDPRILESAAIVAKHKVADLILLGESDQVLADATNRGLDLSGVKIQSMNDPELVEQFAAEYAKLRAKKGVTLEQAKEKMTDPSYFGTMMVHLGIADGMVSGAAHTTANTIRPSLEFIKARPGIATVSGSFLMCLADQVVVYADCAVTPEPTAEQLASIAIASAQTAESFGISPRVAMLSYSTGDSGSGPAVDKVREALALVKQQAPDLAVDGPIQFDAAVDATVGAKKMPGSQVAGKANVFVFPDLNCGNITYKAVQRNADAVAIGPMLQGLNKPVNDLSRGALVEDIVNTVVITAIQAQNC